MQELSEASVGKSWDDPKYQEAIRTKGQRSPRAAKDEVTVVKKPLCCTNCDKPFFIGHPDHCQCLMWDIGKAKR